MGSSSRTTQFATVFKILKKHYKPVTPNVERPVLEHLLLACCLEDAHYEAAEEAFATVVHTFFDWNEIRVTTIAELSEVMSGLPRPRAAANRLKRVLQSLFEATYSFDLEELRKKNLGPTVKWLHKLDGTTNFLVAYVVQSALGGHAIAVDSGVLGALRIVDMVTDEDVKEGVVPGLERAIAKAKGIEFGSMLHQFGADFTANPYSPEVRKILLEIDPDCQDRLPKRRNKKKIRREKSSANRPKKSADGKQADEEVKPASGGKNTTSSPAETAAGKKAPDTQKRKPTSEGLSKRKPR